jgi:hypothetical protein
METSEEPTILKFTQPETQTFRVLGYRGQPVILEMAASRKFTSGLFWQYLEMAWHQEMIKEFPNGDAALAINAAYDHLRELCDDREVDAGIIRRWYRDMTLRFHPDREGSHEAMKAINQAHDRLAKLCA